MRAGRGSARRWIVIALVGFAGVVLAGFLIVRWALDPDTLRPIAEARLTAALGRPVTIRTVRLGFLPRLTVEGTDVVVDDRSASSGGSLAIGAVRLYPRVATILSRPIVIEHVEIERLIVTALRDRAGHWALPLPTGPLPAPDGERPGAGAAAFDVSEVTLTEGRLVVASPPHARPGLPPASVDRIRALVRRAAGGETTFEGLSATIGTSTVAGGATLGRAGLKLHLAWTNLTPADLPIVLALAGAKAPAEFRMDGREPLTVDLAVSRDGAVSATGKLAADQVQFGTLTMNAFRSPVRFAANRLTLDGMAFRAYAGSGRGRFTVNLASSPATWSLDGALERVDIDRFLSANTPAQGRVLGLASLQVAVAGASAAPVTRSLTGTVDARVTDGVVRNFGLMAALYAALKLGQNGERDLRFQQLTGRFAIAAERATTDNLVARTGELTFEARGSIGFDQALALTGIARFSAAKSAQMIRSVRELSALTNAAGEIEVPVGVSGTLAAPHFAIDAWSAARRGVEKELKRRIGDLLKGIIKK